MTYDREESPDTGRGGGAPALSDLDKAIKQQFRRVLGNPENETKLDGAIRSIADADMLDEDIPREIGRRFQRANTVYQEQVREGQQIRKRQQIREGQSFIGRSRTGYQESGASDWHEVRAVNRRAVSLVGGFLMALVGWSGCRSSPMPEVLFSEAENLRLRYEKDATSRSDRKIPRGDQRVGKGRAEATGRNRMAGRRQGL